MDTDRQLGMDCPISRRQFVNGVAVGLGALSVGPLGLPASAAEVPLAAYPPARTGMRGSHPGAFEAAHALRDGTLKLADAQDTGEDYDLVIVGGGLSGLSAAHFFHQRMGAGMKVLILDNHDDFGGHAKRNEFTVNGRQLVVNGGTLNIESPSRYNRWAQGVLDDLGVDLARFRAANTAEAGLYQKLGLKHAWGFDKETFGADRVVPSAASGWHGPDAATVAAAPLSAAAKAGLTRLLATDQPDYLPGMDRAAKLDWLARHSFRQFLIEKVGLDPQAEWFFSQMGCASFCVGSDATPALYAWVQGYPGFSGMGLGAVPDQLFADLPGGQHGRQREGDLSVHFPDGNATVARLLVSRLVPASTTARTQEDMGTAVFDYAALDRPGQPTRIRLSSIVVNVAHLGDPARAGEVAVRYMAGGTLRQVRGAAVILASWNMMIPYLMPELPEAQKAALHYAVKGPLVYTSVALTNWRAMARLGVSRFTTPNMFHQDVGLTEAVSLGGLKHAANPDEPVVLHLAKYMTRPGLPRQDQHRLGRADLLALSFADFERETRAQLVRLLGPGGFDPRRDIAAVTVNRWPHGYAYTYNSITDPVEWVYSESPTRPCVIARQPFGLVSIANSDAAASPHTDAAMLEAHRAVQEVIARRTYPFVPRRVS
ncbi:FAD/NAD(P)-binding protein [Novosphingobium sp. SG720]|uniref:FAD-dependent oxidoreductase n=1 Tax=Novosphingobium sp. SG720 TaxID=2586998 RepID=UPI001803D38A|nr:FAD/NAD(P)-binding protein [Novosphingobium sp. SG720]NKJ41152.1 spermidine dehydrogenase [Novosphingobium sp. SG720]